MKWDWWYPVWAIWGAAVMGVVLWHWLIKPMGELLGYDSGSPDETEDT